MLKVKTVLKALKENRFLFVRMADGISVAVNSRIAIHYGIGDKNNSSESNVIGWFPISFNEYISNRVPNFIWKNNDRPESIKEKEVLIERWRKRN